MKTFSILLCLLLSSFCFGQLSQITSFQSNLVAENRVDLKSMPDCDKFGNVVAVHNLGTFHFMIFNENMKLRKLIPGSIIPTAKEKSFYFHDLDNIYAVVGNGSHSPEGVIMSKYTEDFERRPLLKIKKKEKVFDFFHVKDLLYILTYKPAKQIMTVYKLQKMNVLEEKEFEVIGNPLFATFPAPYFNEAGEYCLNNCPKSFLSGKSVFIPEGNYTESMDLDFHEFNLVSGEATTVRIDQLENQATVKASKYKKPQTINRVLDGFVYRYGLENNNLTVNVTNCSNSKMSKDFELPVSDMIQLKSTSALVDNEMEKLMISAAHSTEVDNVEAKKINEAIGFQLKKMPGGAILALLGSESEGGPIEDEMLMGASKDNAPFDESAEQVLKNQNLFHLSLISSRGIFSNTDNEHLSRIVTIKEFLSSPENNLENRSDKYTDFLILAADGYHLISFNRQEKLFEIY